MHNYFKFLLFFVSFNAYSAGAPVSNIFSSGDIVSSSQINANFQELADRIDILATTATWSTSNTIAADGTIYDITTITSDATYVLKEIIHSATGNTPCSITAGGSLINLPSGTYQLSLTQGITLNTGDTISVNCFNSNIGNLQVNMTISGIKYNTP